MSALSLGRCARLWMTLAFAFGGGLQGETPVRRIRQKVVDSLANTPDFACSVSFERGESGPNGAAVALPALEATAGVINGKEIYAWPADAGDQSRLRAVLAEFAKGGTGTFALYSRALFLTTDASYYGVVNESAGGDSLLRTDFAMPKATSTYSLNVGGVPVTLGYTGTIWLEPATLEMVRLALHAGEPPPGSDLRSINQTFQFTHARFGPNTVLLPETMQFDLVERSGKQQHITAHVSDCRQYVSKRGDLFVETAMGPPTEIARSKTPASTDGRKDYTGPRRGTGSPRGGAASAVKTATGNDTGPSHRRAHHGHGHQAVTHGHARRQG